MMPKKADTPHVPLTPEEIAEDTFKAYKLGASVVHIHARDEQGEPTHCKEVYSQIFALIRKQCPGMIICASTSGRTDRDPCHRAEVLELRPDLASLMLGCVNSPRKPSINTVEDIIYLLGEMGRYGVKPELEVFDPGFISMARYLAEKGHLCQPLHFNLLLGSHGNIPAGLRDLVYLADSLPFDSTWSATGIGKHQLRINAASILMGGHVRVGLEDALYFDHGGRVLATNERLVRRIVNIAAELGREIASPAEARAILGLVKYQR